MKKIIGTIGLAEFMGECDDCGGDGNHTLYRPLYVVSGIGNTRPGGHVYLCDDHLEQLKNELPMLGITVTGYALSQR